ncbi:MAG: shikimate kinase [Anaerolineae bacterium]
MATTKPDLIVITGFMGTGKTTVGQQVAALLGWPFVDADEEIVRKVGLSIPEIFAREGEPGFRQHEKQVCRMLAERHQQVVATGGGMLVDDENRAVMLAHGFVVCLVAAPESIRERLATFEGRPLAPQWEMLLEQRRAAYAAIPVQIDTTHLTPEEVAQEIVNLWQES